MNVKPIPTEDEMLALATKMGMDKERGLPLNDADRITYMRGAVYYGAIAKGKTPAEAVLLAQSSHVEDLGRNLDIKVE